MVTYTHLGSSRLQTLLTTWKFLLVLFVVLCFTAYLVPTALTLRNGINKPSNRYGGHTRLSPNAGDVDKWEPPEDWDAVNAVYKDFPRY